MFWQKANILFILKIATELLSTDTNFGVRYYKQIFRAFKNFNKTGEHYYYKVTLSDIDLERFQIKYLFFKEDMKEGETTFKIIRIGDLLKEYILYYDWKKAHTFDDLILFKRHLGHDKLYNVLYVNKRQLKFIIDLEKRNNIKWYKITEQDREIIRKGCFNLRYMKNTQRPIINTIEEVKAITLKDVLSLIPIKLIMYDEWIKTNKEKKDIIITHYFEHCSVNDNIKIELIKHLREVLIPLFEQTPQEEKTYIEDYKLEDSYI